MNINNYTLEIEKITVRGKTLKIVRPAKLEELFQGDPFLESEKFPLWFKIWEASLVLADYLATLHPSCEILEIGAGLGVPSLVASAFGHKVLASDLEVLPLKFLEKSAKENGLSIETQILDLTHPNLPRKFDLIVGAEIVFKKKLFDPLLDFFKIYLKPKGEVLLAHASERKKILIPFLYKAQAFFEIQTSIRRLRSEEETIEIIFKPVSA